MFFQSLAFRVKRIAYVGKVFEGLNKEFWIGHLLVMVSTVLGVYLAAHSGLKSAIEFDSIASDRDNYYLRANLRDEVLYNISIAESIIKTINKIGTFDRRNYPNFQTYVLDTMKEQSNTLKTPNIILNGTLQYYGSVHDLLEQRQRHLISYTQLAGSLRKTIDRFRTDVIRVMDNDLASLKQRLESNGVKLYY